MDLPINFPSDADVIAEEAARFRSLSPGDRLRSILGMIATGTRMMRLSPKSEFLKRYKQEQEDLARQSIQDFIARHAE